jgi:hypothetical protein
LYHAAVIRINVHFDLVKRESDMSDFSFNDPRLDTIVEVAGAEHGVKLLLDTMAARERAGGRNAKSITIEEISRHLGRIDKNLQKALRILKREDKTCTF